jgi:hypothetical protein
MCGWSVNGCVLRCEVLVIVRRFATQEANEHFQHLKLTKWELLAAMQALSIYIIIRLDEGETDYNGFDSLLFTTVIVSLAQFTPY